MRTTTLTAPALGALGLLFFPALAAAQIGFDPAISIPVGERPDGVAAGDFNGDGRADVVVATDTPDKLEVLLGTGACGLAASAVVFTGAGSSPAALVTGDFDQSGNVDIAVTLKGVNQLRLVTNTGGGGFLLGSSAPTGDEPRNLATADLNGNGQLDFATSNRESDDVTIILNQGGVLSSVATLPAGGRPRGIALADLDGDGLADLAVASSDTREILVRMNLGGATFGPAQSLSVGPQVRPEGVAIADVNGDGAADILAATSGTGFNFVTVFLNNGNGTFGGPIHLATGGLEPDSIATGDFDGDGDIDIAVTNQDSNTVSVLENLGGGSFGPAQVHTVGVRPGSIVAADLRGDGRLDLVSSNRDSNNLSLLCNQSAGGAASTYCVGAPNSAGTSASIGFNGSLSVAANAFTLTVSGAVPSTAGLFFYGDAQTQQPFGDGFRCVTGNVFRLEPPAFTDGAGSASRAVDFTTPPAGAGASQITGGSTWNFQFWYRDPASIAGGGAGFNLSNALSVTFGS